MAANMTNPLRSSGHHGTVTNDGPSTTPPSSPFGHTLEDLEAATGVPARTIRFYRQSGLIDAPTRIGRNAYYSPDQLDRLHTVASLREQGLGLDAIARVLADPAGEGVSLATMLRLGVELSSPWIEDRDAELTADEVLEIVQSDIRGNLARLERYGMIERVPRSKPQRYRVRSVGLLQLAGQLSALGVSEELASDSWLLISQKAGELGRQLVELYTSRLEEGFPGWPAPEVVGDSFRAMGPITLRAVELAMANAMRAALDEWMLMALPSPEPGVDPEPGAHSPKGEPE